jgi:large subunit ribosomal protein L9
VIKIAKVLLTQTIDNLGHVGEVVDVADGYARNFLFPQGLALEPSAHNKARYAKAKAAHAAEMEEHRATAVRQRDVLADHVLVFTRKAHDDDKLYGSVRAADIVGSIETDLGEKIAPSRVQLEHPLESLGSHVVTIDLYKDISVVVRVRIEKEQP